MVIRVVVFNQSAFWNALPIAGWWRRVSASLTSHPRRCKSPVVFWLGASQVFAVLEVTELAFKRLGERLTASRLEDQSQLVVLTVHKQSVFLSLPEWIGATIT